MTTAIVFADRVAGGLRWGFRVGPARAPLALMPPFAATAEEAAVFAALFADSVEIAGEGLVPHVGQEWPRAPRSAAA